MTNMMTVKVWEIVLDKKAPRTLETITKMDIQRREQGAQLMAERKVVMAEIARTSALAAKERSEMEAAQIQSRKFEMRLALAKARAAVAEVLAMTRQALSALMNKAANLLAKARNLFRKADEWVDNAGSRMAAAVLGLA